MTQHDHEGLESLDVLEAKVDRGHAGSSCGNLSFKTIVSSSPPIFNMWSLYRRSCCNMSQNLASLASVSNLSHSEGNASDSVAPIVDSTSRPRPTIATLNVATDKEDMISAPRRRRRHVVPSWFVSIEANAITVSLSGAAS
jgi:hypothetical protein